MDPTVKWEFFEKAVFLHSFFCNMIVGDNVKNLIFYQVNMKYVRELAKADDNVLSISPQNSKETRPFVGVIMICGDKQYCIPLTSPKSKHQTMNNREDFSRIIDNNGKILGALNFNNMIPVTKSVITPINLQPSNSDIPSLCGRKKILNIQLDWCNKNKDLISRKANKLYHLVTETPEKFRNLSRRCCDFQKLEKVLEKWIEKEYKRCNDVLDRNPVLKSKLDAAATQYNRKHNLTPLGNTATAEERCERRAMVLNENPELKSELEKAEKEFDNKPVHDNKLVQKQSQTSGKPKHRR